MAILDWMAWTTGTLVLVGLVVMVLGSLAAYAVHHPPQPRKGFLPMETSGGDRFYIGLLGTGLTMILWVAFTDQPLPIGLLIAAVWMAAVLRSG